MVGQQIDEHNEIIAHQGLIQVPADNLHFHISSLKRKRQTHSLAMIFIKSDDNQSEGLNRAAI